jgi:hypothetical protein
VVLSCESIAFSLRTSDFRVFVWFWLEMGGFGCFWAQTGVVGRVSWGEVVMGSVIWLGTVVHGEEGRFLHIGGGDGDPAEV